jgi:hypothetical protein
MIWFWGLRCEFERYDLIVSQRDWIEHGSSPCYIDTNGDVVPNIETVNNQEFTCWIGKWDFKPSVLKQYVIVNQREYVLKSHIEIVSFPWTGFVNETQYSSYRIPVILLCILVFTNVYIRKFQNNIDKSFISWT